MLFFFIFFLLVGHGRPNLDRQEIVIIVAGYGWKKLRVTLISLIGRLFVYMQWVRWVHCMHLGLVNSLYSNNLDSVAWYD